MSVVKQCYMGVGYGPDYTSVQSIEMRSFDGTLDSVAAARRPINFTLGLAVNFIFSLYFFFVIHFSLVFLPAKMRTTRANSRRIVAELPFGWNFAFTLLSRPFGTTNRIRRAIVLHPFTGVGNSELGWVLPIPLVSPSSFRELDSSSSLRFSNPDLRIISQAPPTPMDVSSHLCQDRQLNDWSIRPNDSLNLSSCSNVARIIDIDIRRFRVIRVSDFMYIPHSASDRVASPKNISFPQDLSFPLKTFCFDSPMDPASLSQ